MVEKKIVLIALGAAALICIILFMLGLSILANYKQRVLGIRLIWISGGLLFAILTGLGVFMMQGH